MLIRLVEYVRLHLYSVLNTREKYRYKQNTPNPIALPAIAPATTSDTKWTPK